MSPIPTAPNDHEARQLFEAVYRSHYARVRAYAIRRTMSLPDADDVTEETFLVAWRRLDALLAAQPQHAWLLGVAQRVIANRRRGEARKQRMHERLGAPDISEQVDDPERHVLQRAEVDRLYALVERLPLRDQEPVRLAAFEDLSYEEMAMVLDCRPSQVRSRLHRARARLRELRQASQEMAMPRD
jgi:RNA polymerase sigma-70 factor (ECF subfamily)